MAEKIRTSDVIADEIKEKLKSGEVKGEEIADLFREAYANLPNDKTLRDRSLSRLNSLLRNATGSKHKGLLDEEQKTDLRTIRDNGAMADKKEEPIWLFFYWQRNVRFHNKSLTLRCNSMLPA